MSSKGLDLKELKFCLEMANKTYVEYLNNGSIYLYALVIKKYNLRIRELVIRLVPYFPDDYFKGSMSLCHHFDIWLACFEDLEKNGGEIYLESKFTFESKVKFPKDFVASLLELEF